ncbi:MAG: Stk1 family PASTA domain-containing Ser/Thr kinase [Emergencia sp.]
MSKLLAGRYELIEKIGEGGMAVVYKAKCRLLNRYVAIKILRPEFTRDAQFVENFKKESQAAANLQHPNIVSVYDVGKEGNIHFIVMELIDGRPLSDIISEEAPFDYKRAIQITRQVASALSLAHRNNIIHRDVKPHNIMITRDGTAKLTDFGIAKAVSDSTLVTETSRIIGSVHYFSPEQARGAYVDERSDIYSLGIVLYEMLTGQVPFDGENPVQVALMHINDEITPPSKLVPGIPPALEKLVMKATDKFQSNRYRNADELLEDLENIEFVTKMVGNSVFAASDVEEFQEMNRRKAASEDTEEDYDSRKQKKQSGKDSGKSAKNRKPLFIALGVIAAAAAVIGILFAAGILGGGVRVPDLEDMTVEKAEQVLERENLKMEIAEEKVPSETIEEDRIVSQDPGEGEKVKEGDTITVYLSSGKPTGTVPSVIGMTVETAEQVLKASGYELGQVSYEESDQDEGEIIRQDPTGNAEEKQGSAVNVVVSKGTDKISVPSLLGKTYDQAREELEAAGFTVGKPSYQESDVYGKNLVMDQYPAAGEKAKKGSTVTLTVSMGSPQVTPDPESPEDPDSGSSEGGGSEE